MFLGKASTDLFFGGIFIAAITTESDLSEPAVRPDSIKSMIAVFFAADGCEAVGASHLSEDDVVELEHGAGEEGVDKGKCVGEGEKVVT